MPVSAMSKGKMLGKNQFVLCSEDMNAEAV
jgi:hypothetical protein